MNIFEKCTREALRFDSVRGQLNVEILWNLPLTSNSGCDLDTIAKSVNGQLKAQAEESFVTTTVNPLKEQLDLKLDVLKHIIAVKVAEADEKRLKAEKAAEREKLMGVLADKQDAALKELTPEQLAARIKELS